MKIAVVILNWNGKSLLEKFLPSVVEFSQQATVYVIDNASTDDSVPFLQQYYPQVQLIRNSENGGYAKGYNDGLQHINEELLVLLNSDVEVTEGWLRPMVDAFKSDSDLVAAQPKLLDYKNKAYFEYAGAAGGFLDALGYPFCRGRVFDHLEKDEGQYNDRSPIFWASGACMFVRRDAFWKAGGFDTTFFTHQEEIDLCWRLHAQGGRIDYIGASTVYHVGGATLDASHPRKTFYNFRNTLLMLVKNVKGGIVWWRVFLRMLLDGVAGLRFLLQGKPGHFIAILRAHFSFYRLLPKYIRLRKTHASALKYYAIKSVVWNYFIAKKRTFNTPY